MIFSIGINDPFPEYSQRIIDNHRAYAKAIGVEYIHHTNDESWYAFKEFYPNATEYDVINFYKLHLLETYAKKYEEILYIDFDIIFKTEENIFKAHDLTKGVYARTTETSEMFNAFIKYGKKLTPKSFVSKYITTYAMSEYMTDPKVINTGLILGNSDYINKIKFIDNLDEMLSLIDNIDNDIFTKDITDQLTYNNEAMFSFITERNEVPIINNEGEWNYTHHTKDEFNSDNKVFHMISKEFRRITWL